MRNSEDGPSEPPRDEEELLDREERLARIAVKREVEGLKADLLRTSDLEARVRRHPVVSMALSAATGFLAVRPALALLANPKKGKGATASLIASVVKLVGLGLLERLPSGAPRPRIPTF